MLSETTFEESNKFRSPGIVETPRRRKPPLSHSPGDGAQESEAGNGFKAFP